MQNYGKFRKIKILKPIKSAYLAHVKSVYAVRPVTTGRQIFKILKYCRSKQS
jgi:hypothetical protein